jgi:hypothetical protein
MQSDNFLVLAEKLTRAASSFAAWALVAHAVDTEPPSSVAPVVVNGIARPTEAAVLARTDLGITVRLDAARAAAIQAVLQALLAVNEVREAERVYSGDRRPTDYDG